MGPDFRQKSDRLAKSRSSRREQASPKSASRSRRADRSTIDLSLPAQQRDSARVKSRNTGKPARSVGKPRSGQYEGEKTPAQRRAEFKRLDRQKRSRDRAIRRGAFYVLAVIVVGLVVWGSLALMNSPWFAIEKYEVVGNSALTPKQIVNLIKVESDETVITAQKKAIVAQLLESPWIRSAEIKRKLPHTLVVTITERTPALRVTVNENSMWTVSSDGVWLGLLSLKQNIVYSATKPNIEPVHVEAKKITRLIDVGQIDGAEGKSTKNPMVKNALQVFLNSTPDLKKQIAYISAPEVGLTKIYTKSKVEISVGEATDMKTKSEIALAILKEQKGKVVLINVRSVEKPTWRGLTE